MSETDMTQERKFGIGAIATIGVLFGLLLFSIVVAVLGWTSAGDVRMSLDGWIALALGTFFSLLVGIGLMGLVFYSSRTGHDEAVVVHVQNTTEARDQEV
ncbi:hypothetical protein [Bradyrhizobium sp. NBAIM03]|uniref:hypothetical protein n=1 Tax=Bradyrhizobium sp. NBAIM03 TaxID=2793816 RepID=UPI001CD6A0C2|nr:hypothetical protein [Bradyrhizobium sp. NBAIM03]